MPTTIIDLTLRKRINERPSRRIFRDRKNPLDTFTDSEIKEKFRLDRQSIFTLIDKLQHLSCDSARGGAIQVSLKVCLALRYFATGTFQDYIGELIGVSQPSGKKYSILNCYTYT